MTVLGSAILLHLATTLTQADAPPKAGTSPPALHPATPPPIAAAEPEEGHMTFRATPSVRAAARAGRAQTMEEVAGSTAEEMTFRNTRQRYTLNFFGDVSLAVGKPSAPDHHLGFAIGAQDFLIRGELGNNIVASTEFALEPGIGVDVERFNIRWRSDIFYIEAGRSHTAFGYWNNAYHHGQWLQPTIDRPRWVAFEDEEGILPVHWVGLNLGAKFKAGMTGVNFILSVGNGRGTIVDDVQNAGDLQNQKALQAQLELTGIHWPELRAGVAGIWGRIAPQPADVRPLLPDQSIEEVIGGAHVVYSGVPLILIVESYLVLHRAGGQRWTTFGGFGLLGYALGRFTPYVEVERIDIDEPSADPFFVPDPATAPSFNTFKGIAGLRIDVSDWSAIKAEYQQTRFLDSKTNLYQGVVNWSWGF